MKIRDPKTGQMREETDDERKAREAAARSAGDGDSDSGELGDDEEIDENEDDPVKLRAEIARLTADRDKWKKSSRKNEDKAKANASAADELKALKDSQLSEQEKAANAKKDAEKIATDSRNEAARLRVAIRMGLNESQAKRLVGETEEELEADATELLKTFKPAAEGDGAEDDDGVRRAPRETIRVRSGSGKHRETPFDAKKVVDQVYERSR